MLICLRRMGLVPFDGRVRVLICRLKLDVDMDSFALNGAEVTERWVQPAHVLPAL